MSPDPTPSSSAAAVERRPAVWPWLLLPLVALALFFTLRSVKGAPQRHAVHAEPAAESIAGEVPESR